MHPQPESYWGNVNPIGPRACYDEGKRCAETLFFDYRRQHKLRIKVARIFNTYGPRMHPDDGRVVSNFIVQALKGEPITIYGDGQQTRSFCYVDDLIEGLLRLMDTRRDDFTGPVNLGNPGEFTIRELAEKVIELTGSRSKLVIPAAAGRRPEAAPARHHAGAREARLGAEGAAARGADEDHRLFRRPAAQQQGSQPGWALIIAGRGPRNASIVLHIDGTSPDWSESPADWRRRCVHAISVVLDVVGSAMARRRLVHQALQRRLGSCFATDMLFPTTVQLKKPALSRPAMIQAPRGDPNLPQVTRQRI